MPARGKAFMKPPEQPLHRHLGPLKFISPSVLKDPLLGAIQASVQRSQGFSSHSRLSERRQVGWNGFFFP